MFSVRSAAAAESLTFPIDFAKTRMQIKVGRHVRVIDGVQFPCPCPAHCCYDVGR